MSSYDVSTYLLDKENIRDTVLRMVSSSWPRDMKLAIEYIR
jgi:hypothetical protein